MPYGHDLPEPLRSALRGPVPERARAWVERAVRARVVAERPLEGGTSSAVHLLRLDRGAPLVLRRYVLDWVLDEPWTPSVEAAALDVLAGSGVHAPGLVAIDEAGDAAGVPAVLMTALPGRAVWHPTDLDAWLDGLVDVMQRIHAIPPSDALGAWAPYPSEGVPSWSERPAAWERAIAVLDEPRPVHERVLVHRDFHPGNVLWSRGRVTGVVDWTATCVGPREEDVAHCRANLAQHHGLAVADAFLERWLAATGVGVYDARWDLLTAVSMPAEEPDPGLDAFVAAGVARLEG